MESIVRFSLKQKVLYNLFFVLLTVAGFVAMSELPTERYPNVNFGEVIISTYFPGASPTEVETLVTRKLEEAIESVENIEWNSATSFPERSHIRIKFSDDSDYQYLYNEVRLNVQNIMSELPPEIDPPMMDYVTIDDFMPVVVINLGGEHSNRALSLIASEIKSSIKKIAGIKEVKVVGEYVREFHIYLDPDKLRSLGISFDEVANALQDVNVSVPAGNFITHAGEFLIKVDEKFHTREQVVQTIIRRDGDGGFINLEDLITRAELSYRRPNEIASINGKDVVSLQVNKISSGNALEIKENIETLLENYRPLFEKEKLDVSLTQDSTAKIHDGISTLGMNLLLGMVLVSLIIWYFMGTRNAGLVTIGIPFSFMITMLLMYLTGNSINELTLFAFVLVTGIIVDDAIVVCENIYRHIQDGIALEQAIVKGTAEVALPVISATLTTIAAFLPMLIMTGSTGEFFAQIPTAVTYSLIASLIECLLILPIHYLDFGPRDSRQIAGQMEKENYLLSFVRLLVERALKITLKFRLWSVLSVFMLLLISIAIFYVSASGKLPLLKIKFFPDDYSLYYVDIKAPSETPMKIIDGKVREIAEFIMADGPGKADSARGIAGYYINESYEPVFGNNFGVVMVTLPNRNEQTLSDPLKHLEQMRKRLNQHFAKDGMILNVHPQKDGPPAGKDVNLRIVGTSLNSINGLADRLYHFLTTEKDIAPNLVEVEDDRGRLKQIYRFDVLHERVREFDLNGGQVARLAGSVLDGRYIGKYRLNDEEIDLKILVDPETIESPEDALDIPFVEHSTGPILLGDVTTIRNYKESDELHRYQGQRAIGLKADLKPDAATSIPAVMQAIDIFYNNIRDDFPGATIIYGGEHKDTERSYTSLAYAFVIAVLVMYIILAAQFQSYLQPAIILSAIVFALIGVVFGKLFTHSLFTVNSFIAIIGVAGVVVNDSLILIDFMNKNFQQGLSSHEAIYDAIRVRLRPIVLTTLTTTLGLLPMALGIPNDSIVWGSMASTFVTGLATATILTLIIVPVLWDLVQDDKQNKYYYLLFIEKYSKNLLNFTGDYLIKISGLYRNNSNNLLLFCKNNLKNLLKLCKSLIKK